MFLVLPIELIIVFVWLIYLPLRCGLYGVCDYFLICFDCSYYAWFCCFIVLLALCYFVTACFGLWMFAFGCLIVGLPHALCVFRCTAVGWLLLCYLLLLFAFLLIELLLDLFTRVIV